MAHHGARAVAGVVHTCADDPCSCTASNGTVAHIDDAMLDAVVRCMAYPALARLYLHRKSLHEGTGPESESYRTVMERYGVPLARLVRFRDLPRL